MNKKIAPFKNLSFFLLIWIIPLIFINGCGDLEPGTEDKRSVSFNMDYLSNPILRISGSISSTTISQYNSHLILAVPSSESINSDYTNFYSVFDFDIISSSSTNVSLEIPLYTNLKVFAFLFKDSYSLDDLFDETPIARYYGESTSFEIDTTTSSLSLGITLVDSPDADSIAPIIVEVSAITSPTNDNTPSYTFSSNEAGTISYGGSCSSNTIEVIAGNNTITLSSLDEGTYSDCTISVYDSSGNKTILSMSSFTIDTTAPILAEVTAITSSTSDTNPDYIFSSNEEGFISYGGSCSSITNSAVASNNTITLSTLSYGKYSDCTINVTDNAGNISNILSMTSFTVVDLSLLAHYAFEGNLSDNSSYARHLTEAQGSNIIFSGENNTDNKVGQAAWFNGTDTYAFSDNISISDTDNFTISFWIKPDSSNMSTWDSVMATGDLTSGNRFQIDYSGNDRLRFGSMSVALEDNEWQHFVFTKNSDDNDTQKIIIFKDGNNETFASSITTRWDKIKIGLNRLGGGYWKGYIDEFRLYDRPLSGDEVRDLFDSYE